MKKHLVVGLGNVGEQYYNTRHNIGFKSIDYFAQKYNEVFSEKRYGSVSEVKIKNKTIILLKPSTYMNLSGNAINYYLNQNKINIDNLLVISDDLDLTFCQIKIKSKGGHGGHNGHKNIIEALNTNNYSLSRFGIGKNFSKGEQVNYVLVKWSVLEKKELEKVLPLTSDIITSFIFEGIEKTMNTFN